MLHRQNLQKKTESSRHSEYQPSAQEISDEHEDRDLEMKRLSLLVTNWHIGKDPKFYIGIPNNWVWILQEIEDSIDMTSDQIKLILMKIRLNDQFKRLGDQFGL